MKKKPDKPERPVAPAVYRPQPVPKVLQKKSSSKGPQASQTARKPVAPPVYRPEAKKIVQPKLNSQQRTSATAQRSKSTTAARPKKSPVPQPNFRSRLVQLMEDPRVHLETNMTSQFKLSFPFLFVDLNCGWYCEMAAIDYWRAKLHLQLPDDILPKTTTFAFHPGKEGRKFVTQHPTPDSVDAWKTLITSEGPIMASGKVGPMAGALRIGHFVLIVGADVAKGVLILRDPLEASDTFEGKFEVIKDDFNPWCYSIKVSELVRADLRSK